MVLVFGWPRGVGMVRKWKWSLLTLKGAGDLASSYKEGHNSVPYGGL